MADVKLVHASAGCNRVVHALDWGHGPLITYGAHHMVVVYDTEASKIAAKLLGHSGRVNCVRWLASKDQKLISGSDDGSLLVWKLNLTCQNQPWSVVAKLQGHQASVTALAVHKLTTGSCLCASAAADGSIIIWSDETESSNGLASEESWSMRQKISLPLQLQLSVAITALPNLEDWLLLAVGGVDNIVRLLVAGPDRHFDVACQLRGHANWVQALDFTCADTQNGHKILLASGSQDKFIRIWAITEEHPHKATTSREITCVANISRFAPKTGFTAGGKAFRATTEALLIGHEDWVLSVAWQPPDSRPDFRPCLLSASMDRTMALWRCDAATGLWMSEESVGDAGPSNLGYFGGVWSPSGDSILAHGYTGALHLWRRDEGLEGSWTPHHALGGHFGAVVDLCWAFGGSCLLSVSTDQTARLTTRNASGSWLEIARPQVHGHDFSCVCALEDGNSGRLLYASGSEEKVIRILEAPQAFLDTLASTKGGSPQAAPSGRERALGAAAPALGLSNKAVYATDDVWDEEGPDVAPRAQPTAVFGKPLEEHLQQSTLWPEIYKVYGHGNDLFCLAPDPQRLYLASACKAQAKETAAIWIWKVGSWTPVQQLECHTLTVTQLAFTPDGEHLISVSRDRSLAIWQRHPEDLRLRLFREDLGPQDYCQAIFISAVLGTGAGGPFQLLARVVKAHSRIIWTVACSSNGSFFATGSRDDTIKLWAIHSEDISRKPLATLPKFGSSVQALAFAPELQEDGLLPNRRHLLAVGLEDGELHLLQLSMSDGSTLSLACCNKLWQAPLYALHSAAVKRICWQQSSPHKDMLQIATASEDHSIHVYDVLLNCGITCANINGA